jgi:hypothetical protein
VHCLVRPSASGRLKVVCPKAEHIMSFIISKMYKVLCNETLFIIYIKCVMVDTMFIYNVCIFYCDLEFVFRFMTLECVILIVKP